MNENNHKKICKWVILIPFYISIMFNLGLSVANWFSLEKMIEINNKSSSRISLPFQQLMEMEVDLNRQVEDYENLSSSESKELIEINIGYENYD